MERAHRVIGHVLARQHHPSLIFTQLRGAVVQVITLKYDRVVTEIEALYLPARIPELESGTSEVVRDGNEDREKPPLVIIMVIMPVDPIILSLVNEEGARGG